MRWFRQTVVPTSHQGPRTQFSNFHSGKRGVCRNAGRRRLQRLSLAICEREGGHAHAKCQMLGLHTATGCTQMLGLHIAAGCAQILGLRIAAGAHKCWGCALLRGVRIAAGCAQMLGLRIAGCAQVLGLRIVAWCAQILGVCALQGACKCKSCRLPRCTQTQMLGTGAAGGVRWASNREVLPKSLIPALPAASVKRWP